MQQQFFIYNNKIKQMVAANQNMYFLILISISLSLGGIIEPYPTFEEYVAAYNKSYASVWQWEERKNIYQKNIVKLQSLAREGQFWAGVSKFTDRNQQEMAKMKNKRIKPLQRSVTPHFSIKRKLRGPSSFDWRQRGAVTKPKDQGACGDCWAFATAGYCESSLIINDRYSKQIDLSQQYLLQCTQESDCTGGYPSYALLNVINHGIPKEELYPYNPALQNQGICGSKKKLKVKGNQVFVYFMLSDFEMIWLLQASPVIVGVASEDWEHYKGGIMKCKANVTEDHAVLLVGYTTQYWIVKNSWGDNWGEKGFIRISRNPNYNCLMGAEVDVLFEASFSSLAFIILLLFTFLI